MAANHDEKKETDSTRSSRRRRRQNWINKEWAVTIIFSGTVLLLLAVILNQYELFTNLISYIFNVLRPILIGLVIAFVLYKPINQIENFLQRFRKKMPRIPIVALSVISVYLIMLILLVVIIWIVVPSFIESITDFADNIMVYYYKFVSFLNSDRGEQLQKILTDSDFDLSSLRSTLTDLTIYIPTAIGMLNTWVMSLIGGIVDFCIGFIFSIYVLAGRHKLKAQGKTICRHFLPQKQYRRLVHYGNLTFNTFSNYVNGQLTDAFILGLLIFIIMSIGGLEYPMMIAVILGITNMIPYVGPWIGTIPCALILLIINPWHAVAFVIIVIIAQQIDNNLIYPRVVGSSVGLPALWVLFAITVGGRLFGIMGMIVGVPVMSIIYTVIKEKTAPDSENAKTKKKSSFSLRQSFQKVQTKWKNIKESHENDDSDETDEK